MVNTVGVAISVLILIFLAFVAGGVFSESLITTPYLSECEAELPRNLHCEMVYSARVVEAE